MLANLPAMSAKNRRGAGTAAIVLAGGKGTRLGALTRNICKPALPFGAAYRNIDFSLANCLNSGVCRIGIATQHKPEVLLRHIRDVWQRGRSAPGDLISAWPAQERAPDTGYRGTADAVFRNLDALEQFASEFVLVLAGDHVYKMDYRPMLAYHVEREADVTVGCIEVAVEQASQFGIVSTDRQGRMTSFIEKPRIVEGLPGGARPLASMGIYVFSRRYLADILKRDASSSESSHDFGRDILPRLIHEARVFAYRFREPSGHPGYWRDVGTPAAYWRSHLDLLGRTPPLRLDDPSWPLPSVGAAPSLTGRRASSRHGVATNSLVTGDCEVMGKVSRSVLFSGVCVESGAVVENAVLMSGATIGRNCRVHNAIIESGCSVPEGSVIGVAAVGHARDARISIEPIVVTRENLGVEIRPSVARDGGLRQSAWAGDNAASLGLVAALAAPPMMEPGSG